ncbi:transglycosylase SLT domain-containing protein [Photobacterium kagoshimensis]|uniref:transglycosylase SLT domain-containing protein n=1 Tax=Photobacterium kagoshimensis TaxID=2910242 RepID=UPI003D0FC4B3
MKILETHNDAPHCLYNTVTVHLSMLKSVITALILLVISTTILTTTVRAIEISPIPTMRHTGDLNTIKDEGVIRVLVAADLGFYYLDKGKPKGVVSEMLILFEKYLAKHTNKRLHLSVIPIPRDQLLPALMAGVGDIAAANLTITAQRAAKVDFSTPILKDIDEVFITSNKAKPITGFEQLADRDVWIRPSSSYYQSIRKINRALKQQNLPPMQVHFIEETMQDYELLKMIQSDMISMTVLDSHKAEFWDLVTDDLQVHTQSPIRTGGQIGWMFRKDSPELAKIVNGFIDSNRRGTLNGNIIFNRYLNSQAWFKKVVSPDNIRKFKKLEKRFTRYGDKYEINWLIIAAQAFQESQFDQSKRSHAGAVGIMQVLPQTAREPYINIPNIYNIDNNIHAGVKYMDFILEHYYQDEDIDEVNKLYFALASYNAGPNRIKRMRKLANEQGFNGDEWFNNVEVIVRKKIGLEPVIYVGNISRYYTIYKQIFALQNIAGQRQLSRIMPSR